MSNSKNGFTIIDNTFLKFNEVFTDPLTKLLYLCLLSYRNFPFIYISEKKLAMVTRVSQSSVRESIDKLIKYGLIRQLNQGKYIFTKYYFSNMTTYGYTKVNNLYLQTATVFNDPLHKLLYLIWWSYAKCDKIIFDRERLAEICCCSDTEMYHATIELHHMGIFNFDNCEWDSENPIPNIDIVYNVLDDGGMLRPY